MAPSEFISLAEPTGLIVQMDNWALSEACRQMNQWQGDFAPNPPLSVSVNLSPKPFNEEDLSTQVEEAFTNAKLDPPLLNLEITESAVLQNREAPTQLKAHRVKLRLDGFGTGYSSFGYLHHLPYGTLNIDRSFVDRLGAKSESSEIIQVIIVLAQGKLSVRNTSCVFCRCHTDTDRCDRPCVLRARLVWP